jgi:DNA polymerase elongation subunit (family B)
MYGVAGDSKFGLYHPKIAAAITFTSRATLNRLKTIAQEHGSKVLYGHTDSVFCDIGSPSKGEALIRCINDKMKPIEVEFEKWCPSMVLMAKNRYAANVTWSNGKEHEPNLYIKGIEMKQARMPPIMKDVMGTTLSEILAGSREEDVNELLNPIITSIVSGEVSIDDLCMKGKLERNLSDYKVLSGPSAGAAWANEFLGKGYRKGSYFKVIIDDNGKYLAFDEPSDIEGIANVGYKIMCDSFVIQKIKPYYDLMGWSIQPLLNAYMGLGYLSWV